MRRCVLTFRTQALIKHFTNSTQKIHNIRWASPEAQQQYPDINLGEWDAVAESAWHSAPSEAGSAQGKPAVVQKFYEEVLVPDERRFLFSEALQHVKVLEPGSVVGDKTVLVEGGEVVVEWGWAREVFERYVVERGAA